MWFKTRNTFVFWMSNCKEVSKNVLQIVNRDKRKCLSMIYFSWRSSRMHRGETTHSAECLYIVGVQLHHTYCCVVRMRNTLYSCVTCNLLRKVQEKKLIIEGRINYLYWSGKIKITIFSRWCQYKWQVLTYHSGLIKMLLYHDIAVVISIEHINVLCFVKYLRCTTSI